MKQLLISIALAGSLLMLSACKNDNGKEPDLESVFKVTPTELSFTKDGGTQELTLNVSNSWKAEVNAEWCTLSRYEGEKDEFIKVTAKASTSEKETLATIKFYDTRGNSVSVTVKRAGKGEYPTPTPIPTPIPTPTPADEKCKASDYPHVTIGTQTWMAENYRCSKYDTESEAYNASWLTNNTIPTSDNNTYTPHYTDASDKSKWITGRAGNLTDPQVAKLGYLYNWAAAVGVADGYDYGTKPFSGNRQGICPNGWHIPSRSEWQALEDYIEKTKGRYTAGKHLKTTSGWYDGDSDYKPGLDTYGFAALPAGCTNESSVYNVGGSTSFWTATPDGIYSNYVYYRYLYNDNDNLYDDYSLKNGGLSVRCLKDSESPTPTPTPADEKCNASDYPQVTIGSQTWMAENYRCSKYDTQSEAYNASWLTNNTIPTSESYTYTPYYTDASDKSKWLSDSKQYGVNLTDAQIKKLGYLYNWAAAVGVADGYDYGTQPFSGNRQGICPNGWHIPSRAEWQTLEYYIEKIDGKGTGTVGKHLKTTSGWYSGDSAYKPGLDTYGFAALPAGYAIGSSVGIVGDITYFCTATPSESGSDAAYNRYLGYTNVDLGGYCGSKISGQSVRCLKN